MTELLMIKDGGDYFRFTDQSYLRCEINKGSVFPIQQVEKVRELCATLQEDDITGARIIKLTITEEPYD